MKPWNSRKQAGSVIPTNQNKFLDLLFSLLHPILLLASLRLFPSFLPPCFLSLLLPLVLLFQFLSVLNLVPPTHTTFCSSLELEILSWFHFQHASWSLLVSLPPLGCWSIIPRGAFRESRITQGSQFIKKIPGPGILARFSSPLLYLLLRSVFRLFHLASS